jgi:lauroyl/myristoyl acyltransferase
VTWGLALKRGWIAFDYDHLLPCLARLPVSFGRALAALRGRIYARLARDWRQFSFDDEGLLVRTRQAFEELMPGADAAAVRRAVRRRYVMQSLEELEAAWLSCRDLGQWSVEYVGLEPVLAALKVHGRAVFVTAHFSSSILGTIHLHRLGIPVLGMSSNVVDDPRVHPAIGRFYRKKYAAMGRYLRGGKILDRQGNAREFIKFLKKGGAVVIVGDLPPDPNEVPMEIQFLGKVRGFASGAARMADIVCAPLLSFVCEYTPQGYRVTFTAPAQKPFALIEAHIMKDPAAWWAADLLPLFPLGPKTNN